MQAPEGVALLGDAVLLAVCPARLLLVDLGVGFCLGLVDLPHQAGALLDGERSALGVVAARCHDVGAADMATL